MKSLLKKPSAWIPFVLTSAILIVFVLYFAGIIPPDSTGDEGTAAHLFQIWAVVEFIAIGIFGLKWFSSNPKETLTTITFQVISAAIPFLIVFSLHL